jgi:hypothetical protein
MTNDQAVSSINWSRVIISSRRQRNQKPTSHKPAAGDIDFRGNGSCPYGRSSKSGMTAPHARVVPSGLFCGQSAVRSCRQSVSRALGPSSATMLARADVQGLTPVRCHDLLLPCQAKTAASPTAFSPTTVSATEAHSHRMGTNSRFPLSEIMVSTVIQGQML